MDDQRKLQCFCSYKCSNFPPGYDWIKRRTWYFHEKKSLAGEVHHSVKRLLRLDNPSAPNAAADVGPSTSTGRRIRCYCRMCKGNFMWSQATVNRHIGYNIMGDQIMTVPPFMEAPTFEDYVQNDVHNDIPEQDIDASTVVSAPEEASSANTPMNLQAAIMSRVIDLQAFLDKSQLSIEAQGEILKTLFGSLTQQPQRTEAGLLDYKDLSLGRLLSLAGPHWNGDLHGFNAPTSWKQLMDVYKGLGMGETQRWRLCTGDKDAGHSPIVMNPHDEDRTELKMDCVCIPPKKVKHRRDCFQCGQKCPSCLKMRKDVLSFEYLPISGILANMCLSRTLCYEFLALWRNREAWQGLPKGFVPNAVKEFWDGEKFRECQAFWDPLSDWEVSVMCPKDTCNRIFGAFPEKCEELKDGWIEDRQVYSFSCPECASLVEAPRQLQKGDPRNFALLGHWDGFQSARTRQRSSWSLEIVLLNTGKASQLGPIPILFIPASSEKLVKLTDTEVLSAFLEPFIEELEQNFMKGFLVSYSYPGSLISEELSGHRAGGIVTLRTMLMMFTGDYPAQCKVGGLKDGGYLGCRRHFTRSRQEESCARKEVRHPLPVRSCKSLLSAVTEWRQLGPGTERDEEARRGGISSYSILWRLNHLYNFDLSLDLVHDVMHILSLNILKKYVGLLVATMEKTGQMPDLEKALAIVTQHRPKGLGGRWPRKLKSLGYYKAEEYQLFVMWCLPYILDHLDLGRSTVLGGLGVLLIDISRLFHSYSRRHGWSKEAMEVAQNLLAAWRVRVEESLGPNSSPLEHVAGSGEILDDVVRHGCHDVYWCYSFERQVSMYMGITTNQKLNETSYSYFCMRRFFTLSYTCIQRDYDGLLPEQRALKDLHKYLQHSTDYCTPSITNIHQCDVWHEWCAIVAQSQHMAGELAKLLPNIGPCQCSRMIKEKGILVGPKRPSAKQMGQDTSLYLKQYWRSVGILTNSNSESFKEELRAFRFLIHEGREYRVGDWVVVKPDSSDVVHRWVWKAKILSFFMHDFQGMLKSFFEAAYYDQRVETQESTMPLIHEITDMQILSSHAGQICVRPVEQLMYQFMAFPVPQSRGMYMVAYEFEDTIPRKHLLKAGEPGCCPPYPEVADIMLVKGPSWQLGCSFEYAVVRRVHAKDATQEVHESDIYPPKEQDHFVGRVDMSFLRPCGPRSRRFQSIFDASYSCSWHKLVSLVTDFRSVKFQNGRPVEWLKI